MDRPRCPGQDQRFWKPGDIFTIDCPHCGAEIEFFKDEPTRPCSACKAEVRNPKIDLGCAKWCKHADQCIGTLPGEKVNVPIIDRLAVAVEKAMGLDLAGLDRARKATDYARRVLAVEGGDPLVVQAVVLFNEAARHSHLAECHPFEPGDPCQTKRTLEQAGLDPAAVARVCQLLWAVHTGLEDDSPEFRAAWDAVQMTALESSAEKPANIETLFRTVTGRVMAQELAAGK